MREEIKELSIILKETQHLHKDMREKLIDYMKKNFDAPIPSLWVSFCINTFNKEDAMTNILKDIEPRPTPDQLTEIEDMVELAVYYYKIFEEQLEDLKEKVEIYIDLLGGTEWHEQYYRRQLLTIPRLGDYEDRVEGLLYTTKKMIQDLSSVDTRPTKDLRYIKEGNNMAKDYNDLYAFIDETISLADYFYDQLSALRARLKNEFVDEATANKITDLIEKENITVDQAMDLVIEADEDFRESKIYQEDSREQEARKAELLGFTKWKLRNERSYLFQVMPRLKEMSYPELQAWAIREDIIDPSHE